MQFEQRKKQGNLLTSRRVQSWRRSGRVGPIPGQMWERWAQSRRRCGRGWAQLRCRCVLSDPSLPAAFGALILPAPTDMRCASPHADLQPPANAAVSHGVMDGVVNAVGVVCLPARCAL